jgi:hypothetical protein
MSLAQRGEEGWHAYSAAGLVVAGHDYLLLLHGQGQRAEARRLVLEDAGVEAVLL